MLSNILQVEEEDDFKALINPKSKFETPAVGDLNMSRLKKGDIIQLERKGYYIVDVPAQDGVSVVLFSIPDGRVKAAPNNNNSGSKA
jgi:glutamyl-tRNA synthetase